MRRFFRFATLGLAWLVAMPASAQELEPRALTNVPVGTSFLLVGYAFASGSILLDPAIPIEELDSDLHTVVGAWVRSVFVFGKSGKLDVVVPWVDGAWKEIVADADSSTGRRGFGDPRVRISVNFAGAPALRPAEFAKYEQGTIHSAGPWIVEAYVGGWLFTENEEYLADLSRKQKPMATTKVHLIRATRKGRWIALDLGYAIGGRAIVEGIETDSRIAALRLGLTAAFPVASRHTLRFVLASGTRIEKGPDYDALGVSYQYRWGN
jgi:hypothetical protein